MGIWWIEWRIWGIGFVGVFGGKIFLNKDLWLGTWFKRNIELSEAAQGYQHLFCTIFEIFWLNYTCNPYGHVPDRCNAGNVLGSPNN